MPIHTRGRPLAAMALLLALLVGGCSPTNSGGTVTQPTSGLAASSSDEQAQYLADGKVTLGEYQAAFAAFESCVTKQGGRIRVVRRDAASGAVVYETGAETGTPSQPNLASPEGRCYGEYFGKVEVAFQSTDPAFLASLRQQQIQFYLATVKPCLDQNGIPAPATAEPGSDEFARLTDNANSLAAQGKCPS